MYEDLCFKAYYDVNEDNFYPNSEEYAGKLDAKYLIEDCYSISICGNMHDGFWAFEENRIKKYAEETNRLLTDLHVNPCGDLCVAPKNIQHFKLNHKNKDKFTNNLLVPFLYSHSFFEKHNRRPWPDYSHGEIGYLEAYIRESTPDSKDKTLRIIYALKDCRLPIKKLEDKDFIKKINAISEEAAMGAEKIVADIDKFSLKKFINRTRGE